MTSCSSTEINTSLLPHWTLDFSISITEPIWPFSNQYYFNEEIVWYSNRPFCQVFISTTIFSWEQQPTILAPVFISSSLPHIWTSPRRSTNESTLIPSPDHPHQHHLEWYKYRTTQEHTLNLYHPRPSQPIQMTCEKLCTDDIYSRPNNRNRPWVTSSAPHPQDPVHKSTIFQSPNGWFPAFILLLFGFAII